MESNKKLVEKAIVFASLKHKGQLRKDGFPYIIHPLRVSGIVKEFKKSHRIDELLAASILHDTLEDTNTTPEELKENFGNLVASIVFALTSDEEMIKTFGKTNYLSNKLSSPNKISKWALVIKLADRLDNISDLEELGNIEFAERYKKESLDIINCLETKRELTKTQKSIINEIRKKLN